MRGFPRYVSILAVLALAGLRSFVHRTWCQQQMPITLELPCRAACGQITEGAVLQSNGRARGQSVQARCAQQRSSISPVSWAHGASGRSAQLQHAVIVLIGLTKQRADVLNAPRRGHVPSYGLQHLHTNWLGQCRDSRGCLLRVTPESFRYCRGHGL